MPTSASLLQRERLVPPGRFGAALSRARAASGESLAALSRGSDGRWMPDQLLAVERAAAIVGDGEIRELTERYGLPGGPWPSPAELELMLDRSASSEFGTGALSEDDDESLRIAVRFVALSVLLGLDLRTGPMVLEPLAEALDVSVGAAIGTVDRVLHGEAAVIGDVIEAFTDRVVVPEVGFLVGQTASGSLLLVRRRGGDVAVRPAVPACGTIDELIAASADH